MMAITADPLVLGSTARAICLVAPAGDAQSAGEGFEKRFDLVVIGAAVHDLERGRWRGRRGRSLRRNRSTSSDCRSPTRRTCTLVSITAGGASAEVDGGDAESFVHRHEEVAGAQDAALVAECLVEGLAERDADIFDGVVLIDIEIAVALQFEVEAAVASEELEHVIEETDAGRDLVWPRPSMRQIEVNLGLVGVAVDDSLFSSQLSVHVIDFRTFSGTNSEQSVCMLARADGDAHATFAAGIAVAIANQNAAVAHGSTKVAKTRPNASEDEIRSAGPVANAASAGDSSKRHAPENLAHVLLRCKPDLQAQPEGRRARQR